MPKRNKRTLKSEAEISAMRAEIEEHDLKKAKEVQARADEILGSVRVLADSDELRSVVKMAREAKIQCAQFDNLSSFLGSLISVGEGLAASIDRAQGLALSQAEAEAAPKAE